MIFLDSLEVITESIYHEDSLSAKIGECGVFVNPDIELIEKLWETGKDLHITQV